MTALRHTLPMTYVSSGWKADELQPATFWTRIEFPLWIPNFVWLSCSKARLALRASWHSSSNQVFWFLGDGGCPWDAVICGLGFCVWQRSVRGPHLLGCLQWPLPSTDHGTVPNRPWKIPNVKGHSSVLCLPLMVEPKLVWDNGRYHGYQAGPFTHFSEQVLVWRWWGLSLTLVCARWAWGFR